MDVDTVEDLYAQAMDTWDIPLIKSITFDIKFKLSDEDLYKCSRTVYTMAHVIASKPVISLLKEFHDKLEYSDLYCLMFDILDYNILGALEMVMEKLFTRYPLQMLILAIQVAQRDTLFMILEKRLPRLSPDVLEHIILQLGDEYLETINYILMRGRPGINVGSLLRYGEEEKVSDLLRKVKVSPYPELQDWKAESKRLYNVEGDNREDFLKIREMYLHNIYELFIKVDVAKVIEMTKFSVEVKENPTYGDTVMLTSLGRLLCHYSERNDSKSLRILKDAMGEYLDFIDAKYIHAAIGIAYLQANKKIGTMLNSTALYTYTHLYCVIQCCSLEFVQKYIIHFKEDLWMEYIEAAMYAEDKRLPKFLFNHFATRMITKNNFFVVLTRAIVANNEDIFRLLLILQPHTNEELRSLIKHDNLDGLIETTQRMNRKRERSW